MGCNFRRNRRFFQSFLICLMISGIGSSCLAQGTIYASGTYTGTTTWNADTVKVTGHVSFDTLLIKPGTLIEIQGQYGFWIEKYLYAEGAMCDSIFFTAKDTTGFSDPDSNTGGWDGISGWGKIILKYCQIRYVKNSKTSLSSGAVTSLYNSLDIENSYITCNNTYGIYKDGGISNITNSIISENQGIGIYDDRGIIYVNGCILRNNTGGGVFSHETGKLFVDHSTIELNGNFGVNASEPYMFYLNDSKIQNNNGNGIKLHDLETHWRGIVSNNIINNNNGYGFEGDICGIHFVNNLIYGNNKAGIRQSMGFGAGTVIINNTIVKNSNGIELFDAPLIIYNSICRDNEQQNIYKIDPEGTLSGEIYNSNIEDFDSVDFSGEYINSIDTDPFFIDTTNLDFHLSDSSPCINAGTPDTTDLFLPGTDLDGNPRVFDGRIDMGAFEYQQDNFHILKQPVSQVICIGEPVRLETEAIRGMLGYQWQKNGMDIPSASQPVLIIDTVNLADSGYYNCLILADDKTVSTDTIILSVPNPQPPALKDTASCEGQPVPDLTASGDQIKWYSDAELANQVNSGNTFTTGISDPGLYSFYVTQTLSGCESNAGIVKLTINRSPVINLGQDSTIYTNQNFMLGPYPDSYSYLWNNNSVNAYFEVSGNDLGIGNHTISVVVTDSNTCRNSDTIIVSVEPITDINLTENTARLLIFPNPSAGILNIDISDFNDDEILLKVYNQQGEAILSHKLINGNQDEILQLNINSFPAGIYYLQVITNNRKYMGKVVRQ